MDWSDRPCGPKAPANRTPSPLGNAILDARRSLETSDLGECGALAIRAHLLADTSLAPDAVPCVRTIGRILKRSGLLDSRVRTRRPPPTRGWYLPDLAARKAELDSFDAVEGLVIAGGTEVEVLNAISLHGSLVGSWPGGILHTDTVLECMLARWRRHGLPAYAQFDNATPFQGPHHYLDTLGRVVRLCQQLGVVPVFAPPRETGFQAAIESYNARWQAKVWQRFKHPDMAALRVRSDAYVAACQGKCASSIAAAGALRERFPDDFAFHPKAPLRGMAVFLRRTDETGRLVVMGRLYGVDPHWQHRLVRVEVDFTAKTMDFHGLRRAAPASQPLLKTQPYQPADKRAKGARAHRDVATRGRRLDSKRTKP